MATYTVDTLLDEMDGDYTAGDLSLREAINIAGSGDTILFDASLNGQTIGLEHGELVIDQDLTIDGDINGDDKSDITISGNNISRVMNVSSFGTSKNLNVNLYSVVLTDGNATGSGGNGGALFVNNALSFNMTNSTVSNSSANAFGGGRGGGIYIKNSDASLTNIAVTGNDANYGGSGGGIFALIATTVDITNSTIYGNSAEGSGGGINFSSSAILNLFNSTVAGNLADSDGSDPGMGGGIKVSGTFNSDNSVVAQNTSGGLNPVEDDVEGTITSSVGSFFGTMEFGVGGGNINGGGNAGLLALADNGGSTQTMELDFNSPLIGAGNAFILTNDQHDLDGDGNFSEDLPLDANGSLRIVGMLDIGAVESLRVDNVIDENDGDFSAGDLSLREALTLVGNGGNIFFDASLSGQTITLNGTELVINQGVTIDGDTDGDDKADITIDGNNTSRIFNITGATKDIDLRSLTLTNGKAVGDGGGAIKATGFANLNIDNTTFSNNLADLSGGAIYITGGGTTSVMDSLFTANQAGASGGAFSVSGGQILNLTQTTVHGNSADNYGGGVSVITGTANLFNSTITDNQADADGASTSRGGGLHDLAATINVTNSVVAQNTSGLGNTADDVRGTIDNATNSFIGTIETITAYGGGGAFATLNGGGDPLLAGLAGNGGTTQTRNVQAGSALINAGDNGAIPAGITLDANGNARIDTGTVDIGAVETFIPASFVVSSIDDQNDGDFSAGELSLREAIVLAGAGDTITFDASIAGQTITLAGTELTINRGVTIDGDIDGDDKADITIDGNAASRIFNISGATSDVVLQSLTITNGSSSAAGAIVASGASSLTIVNSTISNSYSSGQSGGLGIYGTALSLINSLIANNSAGDYGGGIYLNNFSGGDVSLVNTTIYGNSTGAYGGGLYILNGNNLTIDSSTISGNRSNTGNSYPSGGAGLSVGGANVTVQNSVIAGNFAGTTYAPDDIEGTIDTATNSFIGVAATITTSTNTANGGGDAGLEVLADNGGTTQTLDLAVDSALIGAGNAALLPSDSADLDNDANTIEVLPVDANGNLREFQTLDIGAVETRNLIIVDNIIDEDDGDFSAGDLSLREAIGLVNEGGTIRFDASLSGQTILLGGTKLELTQSLTIDGDIDGDNKADITISGNNASQVISITGSATDANLYSLTITQGNYVNGNGGGIFANDINSLNIVNSTISDNSAYFAGGGLLVFNTVTTLVNVLLTGNTTLVDVGTFGSGGGALFGGTSLVSLVNTTFYGNSVKGPGGGFGFGASTIVNLYNSTVVGNLANENGTDISSGGGISGSGTLNIFNSVVAQNTSGGLLATPANDDVDGTITMAVNSFFGTTENISGGAGNNNGGGGPLLGQLLNNGGTTLTLSPLDGSLLIGAGSNAEVPADTHDIDNDGNTAEDLPLDGRGGLRLVGGNVDIGAVEQIVDEVIGGTAGDDNIVGGLGNDTATYEDATAGVTQYLLFTGLDTGGAGIDSLSGIENLTGSAFGDRLVGDGGDNVLNGGAGDDILKGKGGNDTFNGGDGNDKMTGGVGNDTMFGGAGADTLIALAGLDTLNGGDGDDFLFGGQDSDTLNGDAGADNIRGNLGVDVLNGGSGSDTLRGGGSSDILNGDADNDFLFGENHSDTLFGGAGDDSLTGGVGGGAFDGFTDTFVYKDTADGGGGFDRIKDFENGIDVMDLQSFGFVNFAAVQALASDAGVNMRINFGGGDVLFVENFQVADFDVGDVLI